MFVPIISAFSLLVKPEWNVAYYLTCGNGNKKLVTVYYAAEDTAENLYSAHISDKDEKSAESKKQ